MAVRIARVVVGNAETYAIVSGDAVATMEDIRVQTGIPVPASVTEFLFGGWVEEVSGVADSIEHAHAISDCELLAPIPSPPRYSARRSTMGAMRLATTRQPLVRALLSS